MIINKKNNMVQMVLLNCNAYIYGFSAIKTRHCYLAPEKFVSASS